MKNSEIYRVAFANVTHLFQVTSKRTFCVYSVIGCLVQYFFLPFFKNLSHFNRPNNRVFDIFLEKNFFFFSQSITWYQQIDSLSSFKPNRMVLPCSQGCPSSAASMSPSAVTVQYKLGWAFKGANVSQAGKIARQGRDGHGVDCGKGVGNTEREYSAPRSKWEPLPAM